MATKKKPAAARKKTAPAKKAAPNKAALKKKSAPAKKKPLAVRTTNRDSVTAFVDYTIAPGANLQSVMEACVNAVRKKSERFAYAGGALLEDLDEMSEQKEADLARFKQQRTPVTARHFELLEVFKSELASVGVVTRLARGSAEKVAEAVQVAMENVRLARGKLARRAVACDIPLADLDLSRAYGSPRALYNAATEVALTVELRLKEFDDPAYARTLLSEFQKAVEDLGDLAGLRRASKVDAGKRRQRQRVLLRALYRYMLWLSKWGLAVVDEDDTEGRRRWRLDKTFPNQDKLTLDPATGGIAVATNQPDPNDDPDEG
jgi:hypothetical protein